MNCHFYSQVSRKLAQVATCFAESQLKGRARYRGGVTDAGMYRELGEAAWAWVLGQIRHDDGPWVPEVVGDDPPQSADDRDSLYAGIAGLAPVLAEIRRHRELAGAE